MFGFMRRSTHLRVCAELEQEFAEDFAILREQLSAANAQNDGYVRGAKALREQRIALETQVAGLKGAIVALCHRFNEPVPKEWGVEP